MEKEVGLEHLHLHSDFSLLDGYGQVEEYADRIPQINQKFLCITDHGQMGAIPRQIRACECNNILPIFGCEMYLNNMHMPKEDIVNLNEEEKKEYGKNYHLLSIAYTNEGYSNLVQLSSQSYLQFYKKPRVTGAQVDKHKKGIIFTSSCYIGEIGQAFDRYGPDVAEEKLKSYIARFSPDFYLEIMLIDFKKQRAYNEWLVKMHIKYGTPMVVSQDCLVAGTVILTSSGSKHVEDVVVGDMVLTHNGRYRAVECINKRSVDVGEKTYRVRSSLGSFAWELTGNHLVRFASVKNVSNKKIVDKFDWKRVDELNESDYLVIPKVKENEVFSPNDLPQIDLLDVLPRDTYWLNKLPVVSQNGNFSSGLVYKEIEEKFISCRGFDCRNQIEIPRYLPVDDDLLMILGLYMAEGGLDSAGTVVSFGLHVKETQEASLVKRFFSKFGIIVNEQKVSDNGLKLYFSSKLFRKFFEVVCGMGSVNKHFPVIQGKVFSVFSKNQIIKIIGQYWKGDGTFPKKHQWASSVTSTSKLMIYDLATFMNALGFPVIPCKNSPIKRHKNPNAKPETWSPSYYVSVGSNVKVRWLNTIYGFDFSEILSNTKLGKKYIECDCCYLVKVSYIEEIDYSGFVYNFQVEEDESYVANLHQVHNCHYCRKEDSQQQRYMLMIRGKKTIKDFENLEDGADYFELQDTNLWLKSEHELDEKYVKRESDGFCYMDIIPPEIYTQAKRNTVIVAQKASGVEIDRSLKLPQVADADARFKEACIKGYKWRKLGNNNKYINRLREEVELITRKGFSSYFLIQQQICNEARRICPQILGWGTGNEAIGPGRGCLRGDSRIVLGDGTFTSIMEVKVGNQVFTIDGSVKTVTNVHRYECDEVLVNIKVYLGDNEGVSLTSDHKVYVEKMIRPQGYSFLSESTKQARKTCEEPVGELKWIPAREIAVGDWLFIPKPDIAIVEPGIIDLSHFTNIDNMSFDKEFVHQDWYNPLTKILRKRKTCSRYVAFDNDWAKLLGLFAGDGWVRSGDNRGIGLAFNSDDVEGVNFITRLCLKYGWDYHLARSKKKKLIQVMINSKVLCLYFKDLFNRYKMTSQTKHIPEVIFTLPETLKKSFLEGYCMSDGHNGQYKSTYTTSSPMLASQVRVLSWQCGIPISMNSFVRIDKRNGRISKGFILNFPSQDQKNKTFYRNVDGGILVKVREVSLVQGDGYVYDLTIDQNHNYLTTSFLVHNSCVGSLACYCLGITDVDPLKHDLLFSRFLSEARGGRELKTRFTGVPIPE